MATQSDIIGEQSSTRKGDEEIANRNEYAFMDFYERQDITDGLQVCYQILRKLQIVTEPANESVSTKASALGERFAKVIIETLKEWDFNEEEELFLPEEDIPGDLTEPRYQSRASSSSSSEKTSIANSSMSTSQSREDNEYEFEPTPKHKANYIPLKTKIKILNMVREHPKWSLKTIQKRGGTALRCKSNLKKWQEQIEKGLGMKEKFDIINKWTYDRFVEARQQMEPVSTKIIQQWACQAAFQYQGPEFSFTASHTWVSKFKAFHFIRQKKVTRYLKSKQALDLSFTLKEAEKFQKRIAKKIFNFHFDLVINTSKIDCEYRFDARKTLTKEAKIEDVFFSDFNKVTHGYTVQYSITASGKLLPKVFLCMQEPKGNFSPHVSNTIEELTKNYGNVFVTASKSGKLTKDHFESFVINVLMEYCKKEKFLLILDSWGNETDSAYFNNIFTDDEGNCRTTIEIIPFRCTPYCQPCDVYFSRQIKNFIKKLHNSTEVLKNKRQLSTREDAIKIHSLIHHQLSAPIFECMIQYAWYASKLIPERTVFANVNEICFSNISSSKCKCTARAFIKCAVCRIYLCFSCFYDLYHPIQCTKLIKLEDVFDEYD